MNELESDRPIRQSKQPEVKEPEQKHQRHFMDIRINADDQSSSKLIIYSSIIIIALILVSVLAQYAIPSSIITADTFTSLKGTAIQDCNSDLIEINKTILCSPFNNPVKKGSYVNGVVKLNQFIAFYLNIINETIVFNLYRVNRELSEDNILQLKTGQSIAKKEIHVYPLYYTQSRVYLDFIQHLSQGDQFYWQIYVKLDSPLRFFGFQLQTKTVNPEYSIFCIAIRSSFFGISLLFVFISTAKYLKTKGHNLPQQRITFYLSYITLTYNDPFYAISILFPNIFTSILSTLFYWNFIMLLIIIWIFFLQRIKEEQSQVQTQLFKTKEIVLMVSFYVITYGYRIGSSIYQTFDRPLIDEIYKSSPYLSTTSFLCVLAFLFAMLYIFNLYCVLCDEKMDLMWRSKVFLNISFFFFVVVFCLFMIGAFEVFSFSPKKLIFSVTFTNIYSYYLQYLYYQSKDSQIEAQQSNKEPSFIEFDDKDISIDLQKDHFEDFGEYGLSKFQGENQTTISYLGQCLKGQGSKIIEGDQASKIIEGDQEQK